MRVRLNRDIRLSCWRVSLRVGLIGIIGAYHGRRDIELREPAELVEFVEQGAWCRREEGGNR